MLLQYVHYLQHFFLLMSWKFFLQKLFYFIIYNNTGPSPGCRIYTSVWEPCSKNEDFSNPTISTPSIGQKDQVPLIFHKVSFSSLLFLSGFYYSRCFLASWKTCSNLQNELMWVIFSSNMNLHQERWRNKIWRIFGFSEIAKELSW